MAAPPIYLLPATLRRYRTKAIGNPAEKECPLCWRNFGTKHDPSDPEERPCRPLQILPCRHVFGSECLRQITSRGISTCPSCRAPFKVAPDESLDNLEWAVNSLPCKLMIDAIKRRTQLHGPFDTLNEHLFDGSIGFFESIWLWQIYAYNCAIVIIRIILRFAPTFISATLVPLTSTWLYDKKITTKYIGLMMGHSPSHYEDGTVMDLWDALGFWAREVWVQVRAPLAIWFLMWVAFAGLFAVLIWAGARRGGGDGVFREEKG